MTSGDSGDMKHGAREAVTVGPGGSAGETDVDTPVRGQATEERIVLPGGTGQTGDEAVSPSAASGGRGRTFVSPCWDWSAWHWRVSGSRGGVTC